MKTSNVFVLLGLAIVIVSGCDLPSQNMDRAANESLRRLRPGIELLEKGKKRQAVAAFQRVLAEMPSDVTAHALVAAMLTEKGMRKESIPFIQEAIRIPPAGRGKSYMAMDRLRDSDLYVSLGDCYASLNIVGSAEQAYRNAVRLNDRNATAWNNWAYMYAERGIKLEESLRLAKRAVALEPDNGCFVDSLGWAYFGLGHHRTALSHLRRAVELSPSEAELRYHLGMALEVVGDRKGAFIEYRKALLLDPSHKLAVRRLRR